MRRLLFERLLALGPRYVQGERSGELVNTAVEGVESLDPFFRQLLPQFFLTTFIPLIVLIAVTLTDWLSGLVLILTAPLLPIFLMLVGTAADAQAKRRWQQLSLMRAHFLDVLQGLPTLKMFGRAHLQEQHIHKVSMQFAQTTLRVLRIGFLSSLVMEMGATICNDEAERHHAFWFFDEDGGGQEVWVFEETKSSFNTSLLFAFHIHLLVRQFPFVDHVRRHNEARLLLDLCFHFRLVKRESGLQWNRQTN